MNKIYEYIFGLIVFVSLSAIAYCFAMAVLTCGDRSVEKELIRLEKQVNTTNMYLLSIDEKINLEIKADSSSVEILQKILVDRHDMVNRLEEYMSEINDITNEVRAYRDSIR